MKFDLDKIKAKFSNFEEHYGVWGKETPIEKQQPYGVDHPDGIKLFPYSYKRQLERFIYDNIPRLLLVCEQIHTFAENHPEAQGEHGCYLQHPAWIIPIVLPDEPDLFFYTIEFRTGVYQHSTGFEFAKHSLLLGTINDKVFFELRTRNNNHSLFSKPSILFTPTPNIPLPQELTKALLLFFTNS